MVKNISNGYFIDIDGILYVYDTGASGDNWNVDRIEKNDDETYIAYTTWIFEDDEKSKEEIIFNFTISSYNGKCVINSCEQQ